MTFSDPLLEVIRLKKYYPVRKGVLKRVVNQVRAVDDISLTINDGETLGLVGESGCGKTTLGWTILRMLKPSAGKILFKSRLAGDAIGESKPVDLARISGAALKTLRREFQIIFQDPYSSLNPRLRVDTIVGEPLQVYGIAKGPELEERVCEMLKAVGLEPEQRKRFPHEFSGGQRQRIMIARALSLGPKLVVADEPLSALDVSIQAQVINLLDDLRQQFGLTYLFISHDLSVVEYISHRVAVMYLGKIVELAQTDQLFSNPKHPYTEALMSAVPVPDPDHRSDRINLKGDVPSPMNPPPGCNFHPRCKYAQRICEVETPPFRDVGNNHLVACHLADLLNLLPA